MANDDRELSEIRARMLKRAVEHLVQQGTAPDAVLALAEQALNAPPKFPIPTIEELERDA